MIYRHAETQARFDKIEKRQETLARAIQEVIIWMGRNDIPVDGRSTSPLGDRYCGRAWYRLKEEFGVPDHLEGDDISEFVSSFGYLRDVKGQKGPVRVEDEDGV